MQAVTTSTLITAHFNMLQRQMIEQFMLSEPIINAMKKIPRELFVPEAYKKVAYADYALPLAHSEFMMTPNEEARMLEGLTILPSDKILEIGTGSGYVTALLASLSYFVTSVDIHSDFIHSAKEKFKKLNLRNIELALHNGVNGYDVAKPYDVICITGGVYRLNSILLAQVQQGGRVFAIIGQAPSMHASVLIKDATEQWQQQRLFETEVKYLQDIKTQDAFSF